jgi:hypothetical protein
MICQPFLSHQAKRSKSNKKSNKLSSSIVILLSLSNTFNIERVFSIVNDHMNRNFLSTFILESIQTSLLDTKHPHFLYFSILTFFLEFREFSITYNTSYIKDYCDDDQREFNWDGDECDKKLFSINIRKLTPSCDRSNRLRFEINSIFLHKKDFTFF